MSPIDAWAIAAILAKAVEYGAALLALGGPLFLVALRNAPADVLKLVRILAVSAALICIAALALRFGIRAARISGMGLGGMGDRMMLGLIWDSPLGTAAIVRGIGCLLIAALAFRGTLSLALCLTGSVLIAASYTQVGHSLGDPRWVLAGALTLHLLAAGFWVAALAPLHRATGVPDGAEVLHRFGLVASVAVPVLFVVGVTFAVQMVGSLSEVLSTAYGWTLLCKITLFAVLLSLAAQNKLKFVPDLLGGSAVGGAKLRTSIKIEGLCVLAILIVTATLTTVTTPPVNL